MVLAAVVTASPAPPQSQSQPALEQLKTIARLRATPFCSALRQRVGPAIEHVMAADKAIDSSPPIFRELYHDDVIARSELRVDFDVKHLEELITPIVSNVEAAEVLLREPGLGEIGRQLQNAVDQQKNALNVLSGVVGTYQLAQVQSGGIPLNWHSAFVLSSQQTNTVPGGVTRTGAPPPGAALLYNAGLPRTPSNPLPPEQQARNVTLGIDPYVPYASDIIDARALGDFAEGAASKAIFDALDRCRP